ncbi:diguanylate cyclase domain-containing protein [Alteromonas facilis]|uniref:sensor domain-containing diguanylate cyclase n=1 Tax=Alteromonas facilis TaxID=2048004 RepID=UPI000C292D9F|nr:diguanylate cyclase [Alteromonas facilis]
MQKGLPLYSIRRYFLYFLVIYSSLLVAVFIGYRVFVEFPHDMATVEEHQRRELQSLNKGLEQKLDQLLAVTTDWAHWTDTYDYVLAPEQNQAFVDDNILSSTFETFDLYAIIILDRNFNVVLSQGFSLENEDFAETAELLNFAPSQVFPNDVTPGDKWERTGWVSTQEGPGSFAVQYITDSSMEAEPAGYLMFVQGVTADQMEGLQAVTRLTLNFKSTSLHDPETHGVVSLLTPQLVEGFALQRKRLLDDYAGTPIMLLTITHDPLNVPELLGWSEVFILLLLVLVPAVLMFAIDKSLIRPLWRNTQEIAEMVEQEQMQPLTQQLPVAELEKMRAAFNKSVDLVNRQREQLISLSMTDSLTGIANRRAFDEHASDAWHHAVRHETAFLLVTLDLDYFKLFNDSLGHPEGDQALINVGNALQKFCRRSAEMCARIGGEEFALIMQAEDETSAKQRVNELCEEIQTLAIPHEASPISSTLTCSIGAIFIPNPNVNYRAVTLSDLLSLVDKELYRAKQAGRNQVVFHTYSLPKREENHKSSR